MTTQTQTDAVERPDAPSEDKPAVNPVQEQEAASDELSDVRELRATLDNVTQELQETKDQLLRKVAEFKNYRRRTQKEVAFSSELGRVSVIEPMLDVFDDLRRSLEASRLPAAAAAQTGEAQDDNATAESSLAEGIELVYKKLKEALVRFGVERIETEGKPFDENLHDAMMRQPAPDDDTDSGVILSEVQPGYRMGDRILRHAKVIVTE